MLYGIAMDYLPIQASAVPCERVFSSSSETDTKKHNRMSLASELLQRRSVMILMILLLPTTCDVCFYSLRYFAMPLTLYYDFNFQLFSLCLTFTAFIC